MYSNAVTMKAGVFLNTINNNINKDNRIVPDKSQVSFRSYLGLLNTAGNAMQSIENSGFLASFLIQDFCGMTVPRSIAGFLRDKEETGEYNIQEGFEVMGREGLTGPCMMAVAPIGLLIAAKFGKSTGINSQLIKRFGNSLKEFITNPKFDNQLLKNADKFKEEFYKTNISKILENTVGKENVKPESIEYILKQLKNYENIPKDAKLKKFFGKSKYRSECLENITEHINNIKYSNSAELTDLRKVYIGNAEEKTAFETKTAFEALVKYSDDAITANKKLEELSALQAESIKHKSLGKRFITNIALLASTLGVLSILPKIYARSNVAPGARKNMNNDNNDKNSENVSFKGKSKLSLLEKIGKKLDKIKSKFVSSELEYNGYNFTNTLMAGLSIFGLVAPRGIRAYKRAQKDENGKKDYTEIWEILIRDVSSAIAVVFAVPILTRACVSSYEKKSGFVLMHKDRSEKNHFEKLWDIINPYSKAHVMSNSEINALYNGVNSKEKMLNFCEYINKNGGDLEKIFRRSKGLNEMLSPDKISINNAANLSKKEIKNLKNIEIINRIKNLDDNSCKKFIEKFSQGIKGSKFSKITSIAKGLNSIPGIISMVLISPYILGWLIPRLTYANTRRIHKKQDEEREKQKLKISA